MILVDKDIIERSKEIFINGYDEENVKPISYDIHIAEVITEHGNVAEYDLKPQQAIMVKCIEEISVPTDLLIRVENKNSLIRKGITVVSPVYNPGHRTPIYIRVENISSDIFKISKNLSIAQLIFEQLSSKPNHSYDQQVNASFNNEWKYRGLSNYKDYYEERTSKVNQAKKELDEKESSIYTNILTMMGIFVSIFSLITVNFNNLNSKNLTSNFIFKMNLSLGIIITLFMALIMIFLRKRENDKFMKWLVIGLIVVLIASLVVLSIGLV